MATVEGKKILDKFKIAFDRQVAIQDQVGAFARMNSVVHANKVLAEEGKPALDAFNAGLKRLAEALEKADKSSVLLTLERLRTSLEAARNEMKEFLLAENMADLERRATALSETLGELRRERDALRTLAVAAGFCVFFEDIGEPFERWAKAQEKAIALAREGGDIQAATLSTGEGKKSLEEVDHAINAYSELALQRMDKMSAAASDEVESAKLLLLILLLGSLVIALARPAGSRSRSAAASPAPSASRTPWRWATSVSR